MARFTRWTNLSEATFVLPPTRPEANYRVRIFTSASTTAARAEVDWELPVAGHPTLGTCHAWLQAGGRPRQADIIVQECGAGLVPVRQSERGLAFAAPPLIRSGPVEDGLVTTIADSLRIMLEDRGLRRSRSSEFPAPGAIDLLGFAVVRLSRRHVEAGDVARVVRRTACRPALT
jgi:predicted PhzF superfamily epimerase YddE/YHI9